MTRPRRALLAAAFVLAACARARAGDVVVTVRDAGGAPIASAVVWIAGTTGPVPDEPVFLDQRNLEFVPSLVVARRGQTLEVRNSDDTLHTVHVQAACCSLNVAMALGQTHRKKLDTAGEALILCDVHAQMRAILLVIDAPFARTDAKGVARLAGVPAGAHTVHAYGLAYERQKASVEVPAQGDAPVKLDLQASKPTVVLVVPDNLSWKELAARIRGSLDEARLAARRGEVDAVKLAAGVAHDRYFLALHGALRAELGRKAQELAQDLSTAGRELERIAGAEDPAERARSLERTDAGRAALLEALEAAAAKLPPRTEKGTK